MEFKKLALAAIASMMVMSGMAQESYFVKTKNAKKTVVKQNNSEDTAAEAEEEEEPAPDFVGDNFKFHSLCNWKEGMKFMVMPEK